MSKVGKIAKGVAIGLVLAIILNIALMAVIWFVGLRKYYKPPKELQAVATASLGDLSGKVSDKTLQQFQNSEKSEAYALGVNANGDIVFMNPKKAWKAAKKEYKEGRKFVDHKLNCTAPRRTTWLISMSRRTLTRIKKRQISRSSASKNGRTSWKSTKTVSRRTHGAK